MAEVCIVCAKEKHGFAVEDDIVIVAIRRIKQFLGNAKNNTLVVCEDDLTKAKEKRARFEKHFMWYGALGALVLVSFLILSRSLYGFLLGLAIGAGVLSISLVSYYPRVIAPEEKNGK